MPETKSVSVEKLALDLSNFRTVPQKNEQAALEAMISTSPDRFWALTESLLDDGYLPTESIIVLKSGSPERMTVREGNRRVAALKVIHKILSLDGVDAPDNLKQRIARVTSDWRTENKVVPCTIYGAGDESKVDKVVTLTHGKGEKAGRDQWNAVARARHNRKVNRDSEPALDLLEKYLSKGKNVTDEQKTRWAGVFPLTVLEEAMKRLAPRLDVQSAKAVADAYPTIKYRDALESVLRAIGSERLGFDSIRNKEQDFAQRFGFPPAAKTTAKASKTSGSSRKAPRSNTKSKTTAGARGALAAGDPLAVRRALKEFQPKGKLRDKVVSLRDEVVSLNLSKTPLAFCFVIRSMFEISAKAYCSDHAATGGPAATKKGGEDKHLVELLREITKHLTQNNTDRQKTKLLHGAMTELAKPEGLLSVTSMNQLVHNPRFHVQPRDIALLFGNILPLLEEMNS